MEKGYSSHIKSLLYIIYLFIFWPLRGSKMWHKNKTGIQLLVAINMTLKEWRGSSVSAWLFGVTYTKLEKGHKTKTKIKAALTPPNIQFFKFKIQAI